MAPARSDLGTGPRSLLPETEKVLKQLRRVFVSCRGLLLVVGKLYTGHEITLDEVERIKI